LAGADYSHVRSLRAEVGPDVMLSGTILDPFSALSWYLGMQPLMYSLYDDPAGVQKACEALAGIATRTGVDMVRHGLDMVRIGAAACCLLSPDLYRRFALPYQKPLIRAIQSGGGIVHLHLCGNVKHLLAILPQTGAAILETITPPPLGDTTLREAKAAIGRRMCLKGNLSPTGALRNGTPEECLREARECLAAGSEGGGFIFSVADNLAPGTPEENIAAVAEVLHG
jgi:uroporphyrinogen-III decarboxylase